MSDVYIIISDKIISLLFLDTWAQQNGCMAHHPCFVVNNTYNYCHNTYNYCHNIKSKRTIMLLITDHLAITQ